MAAILSTSFAVGVTDWAVQWPLASVTGVQIGHLCVAERELAQVIGIGPATTVTVRRGVEGTATAAHARGTPVAVSVAGDVATGPAPVLAAPVTLRQATVGLTQTQILALKGTRQTVVPAAGVNTVVVPVSVYLFAHFVVGYMTTVLDDALNLDYNGGRAAAILTNGTPSEELTLHTFLTITGDTQAVLPVPLSRWGVTADLQMPYDYGGLVSGVTNRPLTVSLYIDSGDPFTGGDAANTLRVTVLYGVLDVTTGLWV